MVPAARTMVRAGPATALLVLAACSFTPAGGDGDGGVRADAPPGTLVWALRSQDDFTASAGAPATLAGFVASGRDVLELAGWNTRGLLGQAVPQRLINSGNYQTITLAELQASSQPEPIRSFGFEQFEDSYGHPPGLGLTVDDNWTAWWEGEVYLAPTDLTLELQVEDEGFLEIQLAPAPAPPLRLSARAALGASTALAVAEAGYYPIRIGLGHGSATADLVLRLDEGVGLIGLSRSRLRAAVGELTGLVRSTFKREQLADYVAAPIVVGDLVDEDYPQPPVNGELPSADFFSQRLAGQLWIEVGGDVAFHVDADNGYRVFVDGVLRSDPAHFSNMTYQDVVVGPFALERGWHDLVLDHQDFNGPSSLRVVMAQGSADPIPLPGAQLRPLVRRGRLLTDARAQYDALPAAVGFTPAAIPDARLVEAAVAFTGSGLRGAEYVLSLVSPDGQLVTLRDHVVDSENAATYVVPASAFATPPPVGGAWSLVADDDQGGDDGGLTSAQLTLFYDGGPLAMPAAARYVSGVHDLGAPTVVTGVRVVGERLLGAAAATSARACADPACTGAGEFSAAFPLAPTRYLQVQLDLTGNDDGDPIHVDDLEVFGLPAP